jgi:pentatricopeptide repeat protein
MISADARSLPSLAIVADVKRGKAMAIAVVASVEQDLTVSSSMADMYAKCGLVLEAYQLFEKMTERSTLTWNS